jgi:lipopolysaccharide transport system permease protein
MGLAWSFFNPLLMLLAYTFVFGVVFNLRWSAVPVGESRAEFALILFVGVIVHSLMAECVTRAPSLILSNANFVKKVVFPLEILPAVALGTAFFHAMVSFSVLLAGLAFVRGSVPLSALSVPLILLPYVVGVLGVSWALAALGVYLRDIGQTIGIVVMLLMFLSPIFYPLSSVPEEYRVLLQLNPLTYFVETCREALIWGGWPDLYGLVRQGAGALLIGWGGLWWFQKTRNGFADVI